MGNLELSTMCICLIKNPYTRFLGVICLLAAFFYMSDPKTTTRYDKERFYYQYKSNGHHAEAMGDGSRQDNCVNVYLLICVAVRPHESRHREVIRNTWGDVSLYNGQVRLMFFLGKTLNQRENYRIRSESNEFHDIVQYDFIDTYRNLTLKSLAMLQWTTLHCPNTSYVLKIDSDVFLNLGNLFNLLKTKRYKKSIIGKKMSHQIVHRDKKSKHYIPVKDFRGTFYPDYISGPAYVISGDIVRELLSVSFSTPLFWVEDVFITGICRIKIHASDVHNAGFILEKQKAGDCVFKCIITGHSYNPTEINTIWKEFNKPAKCRC